MAIQEYSLYKWVSEFMYKIISFISYTHHLSIHNTEWACVPVSIYSGKKIKKRMLKTKADLFCSDEELIILETSAKISLHGV